jgi:hypothetical protein
MEEARRIPVGDPTPWKGDEVHGGAGAEVRALQPGTDSPPPTRKSKRVKTRQPYVPPGPVPRLGLRGLIWRLAAARLYARFGWPWLARLSARERLRNALDDLWDLRKVRKIIVFCNSSGGSGKTTGATWFAAAAAYAFKGNVAVVDANENAGHTADRLRVSPTLTLRKLVDHRHCFRSLGRLMQETDRHRQTGAFVIASEPTGSGIDQAGYQEALGILADNFQLVVCDCGNGLESPTNLGSVHLADELVFTGNVFKSESLDDIISTMTRYAVVGIGGEPGSEAAKRSFAAIFGASKRQRLTFAKRFGMPPANVFVFPTNGYMADTDNPVRLDKLPLRMQVILFESLRALMAAR